MVLAAIALLGLVTGQDPSSLTETQMLRMGRENYVTAYGDANGGNTIAYTEAETRFGNALQHRNDAMLAKKPAASQTEFSGIRKSFTEFNWSCITLKTYFTGGGTMWNTVYAGCEANVEELIWGILSGTAKAKKPLLTSDVEKKISSVEAVVKKTEFIDDESASLDPPGYTRVEALKRIGEMRIKFRAAAASLKLRTRPQSDAALEFCIDHVDISDFVDMKIEKPGR